MKHTLALLFFLLAAAFGLVPSALYSQTQWHLEEYLLRTGKENGGGLGGFVKGLGDYDHDGNTEVAVYHAGHTEIWSITAHTDTLPKRRYHGGHLEKGDINGDGYDDFVIGAPGQGGPSLDSVFVYFGDATGIDTLPDVIIHGEYSNDSFGGTIAIGDINHDGLSDLVIGAPEYPALFERGRVYIYYGSRTFNGVTNLVMTGDTVQAGFGRTCRIGDVNGDGMADLVLAGDNRSTISHWQTYFNYLDVYFGGAAFDTVADFHMQQLPGLADYGTGNMALMDANGDGHTDILWSMEDTIGGPIKLALYYGGTGLGTIPNLVIPPPVGSGVVFFNMIDAGDMDGDGYHDIAVGDFSAFQGSGLVLIYKGGPNINAVWDAGVGQTRDGFFGCSLDSIGDINGDGFADIIVGEYGYFFRTNQGAFSIYLGNAKINAVKETKPAALLPRIATLHQNYPNPCNPETHISYTLARQGTVTLKVFDVLGRELSLIRQGAQMPGSYAVAWPAEKHPAGVYFCQLLISTPQGELFTDTKKMILLL